MNPINVKARVISSSLQQEDQLREVKRRLLADGCKHDWVALEGAEPKVLEDGWEGTSIAQECSICGTLGTLFKWEAQ